jgi:hypothetical protein
MVLLIRPLALLRTGRRLLSLPPRATTTAATMLLQLLNNDEAVQIMAINKGITNTTTERTAATSTSIGERRGMLDSIIDRIATVRRLPPPRHQ